MLHYKLPWNLYLSCKYGWDLVVFGVAFNRINRPYEYELRLLLGLVYLSVGYSDWHSKRSTYNSQAKNWYKAG
jgi:hypothetical protein